MDTDAIRNYRIIEKIMHLNDDEFTELELTFLKLEDSNVSIEDYNRELLEAEEEIKKGNYLDHEQLKKDINSW